MMLERIFTCLALFALLIPAGAACDSESTPEDTGTEDVQPDTPVDAVDVDADGSDTADLADTADLTDTADDEECPLVPPGCIDTCRDEDDNEAVTLGVSARHCRVVTGEDGCPELEFTDEDCGEGTCVWDVVTVECVPPVDCESTECTCPDGLACTCSDVDCAVTCEGSCIVTLDGTDGAVTCAADAECITECTGTGCTTTCAEGGTCSQVCDGTGCTLECDGASECVQECNADPSECTCNGCA